MSESQTPANSFRWKWVAISFLMYVVFYYFPISIVPGGFFSNSIVTNTSIKIIGAWAIAGVFIIAAVSGFIAKDFIMKEIIVAIIFLCILFLGSAQLKNNMPIEHNSAAFVKLFIGIIILSSIAIVGSLCGTQYQKLGNKK